MFATLLVFFAIEIIGFGLSGQGAGPPDVKNFTPILSKELEFRIDDHKKALVGQVFVYQNPKNQNEFVRVYYRQVAIISERAKEKNAVEAGGRDMNLSNLKYHNKREAEALGRVQKATDAFAYIRWHIVRDLRTGQDIQAGPVQIWFLDSSGVWIYRTQPAGIKSALESSPFSEPSKTHQGKRIIVGIQFVLLDRVHIVRIDQDEILIKAREVVNDKK